ncbi:MAG: hypothetical protein MJB14_18335 [Spirochaetes bacterium]|nr:hypothetical protein [Spirochaetota bacterium]
MNKKILHDLLFDLLNKEYSTLIFNRVLTFLFLNGILYSLLVFISHYFYFPRIAFYFILFLSLNSFPFVVFWPFSQSLLKKITRKIDDNCLLESYFSIDSGDVKDYLFEKVMRKIDTFQKNGQKFILHFRMTHINRWLFGILISITLFSQLQLYFKTGGFNLTYRQTLKEVEIDRTVTVSEMDIDTTGDLVDFQKLKKEMEKEEALAQETPTPDDLFDQQEFNRQMDFLKRQLEKEQIMDADQNISANQQPPEADQREMNEQDMNFSHFDNEKSRELTEDDQIVESKLEDQEDINPDNSQMNRQGGKNSGETFIESPLVDYQAIIEKITLNQSDINEENLIKTSKLSDSAKEEYYQVIFQNFQSLLKEDFDQNQMIQYIQKQYNELIEEQYE